MEVTGAKSVSFIAEDYFHNLNPLAKRISDDVKAAKEAYEDLWNSLSLKDKNQVIDESIIQPEIALKYALKTTSDSRTIPDFYPKLKIQTGQKYIIDETGSTLKWRDEHSAPFSFLSRSQMNLNFSGNSENCGKIFDEHLEESPSRFAKSIKFDENNFKSPLIDFNTSTHHQVSFDETSDDYLNNVFKNVDGSRQNNGNNNTENIFTKLLNQTSLLKITNNSDDDMENLVPSRNSSLIRSADHKNNSKIQMDVFLSSSTLKSGDDSESTALLRTPSPCSIGIQSCQSNQDETIPKTGFEFLDNW